mmetsp:Transcript_101837/g.180636  ORF Transcript_101837/g.180636 Transcript_101837/m.180636 type:complete len:285 (-) Transcript_101837:30-884(-)
MDSFIHSDSFMFGPVFIASNDGAVSIPLQGVADEAQDYNAIPRQAPLKSKEKPLSMLPREIVGRFSTYALQAHGTVMQVFAWLVVVAITLTLVCRLHSIQSRVREPRSESFMGRSPFGQKPVPLCEDADADECARLTAVDSAGKLPDACQPWSNGLAASRCPRSCGLCAVVLGDCAKVDILEASACVEKEDVVGEVCGHDGDWKNEAYCTWLPQVNSSAPRRFACARCADKKLSSERRALVAQMLELRMEEDEREAERLHVHHGDPVYAHANSVMERNSIVTPR